MEKKLEIYGARSIIEAIKAGQNIDKVLLLKSSKSSLAKSLIDLIIKKIYLILLFQYKGLKG